MTFADSFRLDGVVFHYRLPKKLADDSRILVLFGGRNSSGFRTLRLFRFDDLADRHHQPALTLLQWQQLLGPANGTGSLKTRNRLSGRSTTFVKPVYLLRSYRDNATHLHWMPEKTASECTDAAII